MNIALVFFTYEADAPLLSLAVQAAPRLRAQGHQVTVYVFDEAEHPLATVPEGVQYTRTIFNRCGNLNGLECITGMASIFAELATKHTWIVKADCDTFVNQLQWLDDVDPATVPMVGTVHVNKHASGACYAISGHAAPRLAAMLGAPIWQGRADRCHCEDRFFWNAALHGIGGALGRDGAGNPVAPTHLHHDWLASPQHEFAELATAAAVDFKRCRWNTHPSTWQNDREAAISRMQKYVNFVQNLH